jgi:hypothetical protein
MLLFTSWLLKITTVNSDPVLSLLGSYLTESKLGSMLKLVNESMMRFYSLKANHIRYLTNEKGKNSNCTVEKCQRHHFNQAQVISKGVNSHFLSPMGHNRSIIDGEFQHKIQIPNLVMKKQRNPK